jgi:amino acid transporter
MNAEAQILATIRQAIEEAAPTRKRRMRVRRRSLIVVLLLAALILVAVATTLAGDIADSPYNPALQPTPAEINQAGPGDAAVNAAGPGMIRCDAALSCVGITPSPKALASDPNVYVRQVLGGLTPRRLAFHVPLIAASSLTCSGPADRLTCVRADQQAPVVPAGTTAIAVYVHPKVRILANGTVLADDSEVPLTVAPVPGG